MLGLRTLFTMTLVGSLGFVRLVVFFLRQTQTTATRMRKTGAPTEIPMMRGRVKSDAAAAEAGGGGEVLGVGEKDTNTVAGRSL